jgi:peptidoglycan/LPS O-acetylase OafA/YrhL
MTAPAHTSPSPSTTGGRRGDLDALRGFAMVLGIALHASLAYFPFPWPVQDAHQARILGLLYAMIHGFRMPLFFLLSGFFTMLLFRRRGLSSLLEQRALRILLPLVIATVTIVPLDRAVMAWAMRGTAADRDSGSDISVIDIDIGRLRDRMLSRAREPGRGPLDAVAVNYHALLAAPRLAVSAGGRSWQLFEINLFDHLWFLWYLCWLVAVFAVAVVAGLPPTGRYRWWLVPASCLPYVLMWSPFGPDTALGILPTPPLLGFYGCFFWFGAATYAAEGPDTPLGARWSLLLPAALLVLLPAGLVTIGDRPLAALVQPAYAWAMSLGLIGLFRRWCSGDRPAVRWLSDASYWMYLVHLPLVIVAQVLLRDQPWPAVVKFLVVLVATVAVTLVTYRWCVRFTPIGRLLNGPRARTSVSP